MNLLDFDVIEGRTNKNATNHLHIYIDDDLDILQYNDGTLNLNNLSRHQYGTFLHEYVHYIQQLTTMFGIKQCDMFNRVYCEFVNYIETEKGIHIPFNIAEISPDIKRFCEYTEKIRGDKSTSKHIDAVEVKNTEIESAKNEKRSVRIGYYDFENQKLDENGFLFGALSIMESMAHLVQSLIDDVDDVHPTVPYRTVEMICESKKEYRRVAKDKKMMISLCHCALMYDNPGVAFFELLDNVIENEITCGLVLYRNTMFSNVKFQKETIMLSECLSRFADDFQSCLEYTLRTRLNYYAKVISSCKQEFDDKSNLLLQMIYTTGLSNRDLFSRRLVEQYGYPYIETANITYCPTDAKNQHRLYPETAIIIGLEAIVNRFTNTKSYECPWYHICKSTQYEATSKITIDCQKEQWKKKEECIMTQALLYYRIKNKDFLMK